jgi:hypothetical protein
MFIPNNYMVKTLLSITFSFFFLSAFSQTITSEQVKDNVGKTVTVLGKVADGRYLASSAKQPTLLNIDKAFPDQVFTVVIYGENRKAFGYKPEEVLMGKNIYVTGKVTMYNGKPQVEVAKPEQIVVATAGTKPENGKETKALGTGEVVLKSTVKLKSGPGDDYKNISKLKPGSIIKVLHTDEGWSYVTVTKNQGKEDSNNSLVGFIKNDELN